MRWLVPMLFVANLAEAQFPPRAAIDVASDEGFVGEAFTLDGSASFDPDGGELELRWRFPNGTEATGPTARWTPSEGGAQDVRLEVTDADGTGLAVRTLHVLDPVVGAAAASSRLHLDPERERLWAVNVDSATVTAFGVDGGLHFEAPVGGDPRGVTGDASAVYVVAGDGTLTVLDAESGDVRSSARVGHTLEAVVATGGGLLVSDSAGALLRVVDGSVQDRLELDLDASAIAVSHDGTRAYVAHFLTRGESARLSVVDLTTFALEDVVLLADDPGPDTLTSGRGVPNLLAALALDPAGRRVWIGALKANTNRGSFLSGQPLVSTNRLRGLLAPVDPAALADDVDERIDTNDADAVSALLFDARGRYLYAAHPGAGQVTIYDTTEARRFQRGASAAVLEHVARFDAGHTPRALALHEGVLYVLAAHDRAVLRFDVNDVHSPRLLGRVVLTDEALPPEVALGQRLFHRSRAPRHSRDSYIACASCHPGGGHDGRTWDFTDAGEGLRNTIDLRGRGGTEHGRVHWSGNFDEIQDFENDIVHAFDGEGLAHDGAPPNAPLTGAPNAGRSAELDALATYVAYLREFPPSPHRVDGELTAAAERGRALFHDPALECVECHVPPRYTDSRLEDPLRHDVGTLLESSGARLGGPLDGLDTPTLHGLWATAPYLHDGRAETLRSVFREHDPDGRHGRTRDLDDAALDDLVAFLLQLDGDDETPAPPIDAGVPEPDAGAADPDAAVDTGATTDGGCAAAPSRGGGLWLLLACFWRRRDAR